jgi:F-type H+-transporting ATPase subunit b
MLREARQQAQDILAQADRRASQIIEEAKVAAGDEGARLVAGAKAEIEQEVSRARESLRAHVATLAVAGAEQILRREVDANVHGQLLNEIQGQL